MFKHLLKLIWNRKGSHGLIIAEIAIAFLVVFGVAATGYHNWILYNEPLGFEWENGLHVMIRNGGDWTEDDGKALEQSLSVLRNKAEIESAHALVFGPFRGWRSRSNFEYGDIEIHGTQNRFTDGAYDDMGLELIEGRWTGPQDYGLNWEVAVINRRMAELLFPDESPIGKNIRPPDAENENYKEIRVVGVFEEFRQMGEFRKLDNYVIRRLAIEDHETRSFSLIIYPRPGSAVTLQEEILEDLQRVAPGWTLNIREMSSMRKEMMDNVITPLSVMALVAGFLILMVGFGLFGVLWQSVTQRTSELGLRRAMGASRQRIYRQIVAEMVLGASIALTIGVLIAIQFPLLGTFEDLDWPAAIGGMIISGTLVLSLCFLCALYPGWLASRRSPAAALHYE
jgi:putative ABC transport system permease protein